MTLVTEGMSMGDYPFPPFYPHHSWQVGDLALGSMKARELALLQHSGEQVLHLTWRVLVELALVEKAAGELGQRAQETAEEPVG